MTQKKEKIILTPEAEDVLLLIGSRLKIARKRRNITSEEFAKKIFVSRKTLYRLEKGDSGVSLAVLVSALWALGLEQELLKIADPEKDKVGIFHERQQLPERIRKQSKKDKLDF